MITSKEIEAAKTPSGGWDKDQLAKWGVRWPPPKGWKEKLFKASRVAVHIMESEIDNPIHFDGGLFNPAYYKVVSRDTGEEIGTTPKF